MVLAVVGVVAIGAALCGTEATVEARPNYLKVFTEKYEKVKDKAKTAKCSICHDPKDKKIRNDYGKKVEEKLGDKKVEDDDKIKDALKKVEKEASKIKDKTYGDLLEAGNLPAAKTKTPRRRG